MAYGEFDQTIYGKTGELKEVSADSWNDAGETWKGKGVLGSLTVRERISPIYSTDHALVTFYNLGINGHVVADQIENFFRGGSYHCANSRSFVAGVEGRLYTSLSDRRIHLVFEEIRLKQIG